MSIEVIETEAQEQEWPRVLIGVPMERQMMTPAAYSVQEIMRQGWRFTKTGYTRCDIARNKMGIALLQSDYTHILMLDSDHIHPADVVYKLIRWVKDDRTRLVVGGLNFRRGAPFDPCAYFLDANGNMCSLREWGPGLIAVDVLGSGCMLIAREAFEQMPFPWFGYDYTKNLGLGWPECGIDHLANGAGWPGTDIWFSRQCRDAGIDQWVDTQTTSPHILQTVVTQETWASFLKDRGKNMPMQAIKLKGGKRCPEDGDLKLELAGPGTTSEGHGASVQSGESPAET